MEGCLVAGLWSSWRNPSGNVIYSYTMLTINADQHPFMRQFHKPDDEKRSVVILHEQDYDAWLQAPAGNGRAFLYPYPSDKLVAEAPQQSLLDKGCLSPRSGITLWVGTEVTLQGTD